MQAHRKRPWDLETDLLVVGAGAAGMTAALVGALEGLEVVLCEKTDKVGGTTAFSAGSVWIPGTSRSWNAARPPQARRRLRPAEAAASRRRSTATSGLQPR